MKMSRLLLIAALMVLPLAGSFILSGWEAEAQSQSAWNVMDAHPSGSREIPTNDPNIPEIWLYTDKMSYSPGEEAIFYVHTTAKKFSYRMARDGAEMVLVKEEHDLDGMMQETPENAYSIGAGWKETFRLKIPEDWQSGVYVVRAEAEIPERGTATGDHFFVVRAAKPGERTNIVMMLATSTYLAYNDWGGANTYRTLKTDVEQTHMSSRRPWARGFAILPSNVPRVGQLPSPKPFEQPRYPHLEWTLTHGFSRHATDAGWAYWERQFAQWAEKAGYTIDYMTQHDLHYRPEILNAYDVVIIAGHDEYWTWEMRDHMDAFIEGGGHMARFAGNYLWQVRLEDNGNTEVVYKHHFRDDPVFGTDKANTVTTLWDHPAVNRPAGETMGLTGTAGVYTRYGGATPRGSGGFTVYRPEHWVFEGADLYYGDIFGGPPYNIVSFEVDGVDYTFKGGLPEPTFKDGTPESLVILALTPAIKGEEVKEWSNGIVGGSISDYDRLAASIDAYYEEFSEILEETGGFGKDANLRSKYGAAVIAVMPNGKGEVFNAGTAGWVNGLRDGDFFTEQITRNVLNRYSGKP